jgi:hypothetical protein
MLSMMIDKTKYCNTHTEERKQSGECCQLVGQKKVEQDTYEYYVKIRPKPKEINE